MLETQLVSNEMLMGYAEMLLEDIEDADFALQPAPGTNHPAWILGHLAYAADGAVGLLGGEKLTDADWSAKFGRDSKITGDRSDYPTRDEILKVFRDTHARARDLAAQTDAEHLAKPNPISRLRENLPTIGDMCTFLLTGHLGVHLGQLSAWRRMCGKPAMF